MSLDHSDLKITGPIRQLFTQQEHDPKIMLVLKWGFHLRLEITESQCDFEAIWLRISPFGREALISQPLPAPPWR
ncbi:hypothetical protein ASE14_14475 [Agromyces sp. Root81]|uniref:hypothetical protein n=1 Tax=Agromyces sp. Root81 TaxID=1736601 RepID=UPI0006FD8915|nr:hypothetical protein [Agromyces sp. Root81]KRC59006.1 hypothetical protein ASE14_14475 [Agromyces sp. Root81]